MIFKTLFFCVYKMLPFFSKKKKAVTTVKESVATPRRCSAVRRPCGCCWARRALGGLTPTAAFMVCWPRSSSVCAHTSIFLELIPCRLTNKLPYVEMAPVIFFLPSIVVQNQNTSVFNDQCKSQTLQATLSFNFCTEAGWSQSAPFENVFGAR